MADAHLGSFREDKLRILGVRAFLSAVDRCIIEQVDFVLIAGDLFNTSLPPIESMKSAVTGLGRLKKAGVPVYVVAGSHDFSPSGKTILEVLEEAELLKNVCAGSVVDGKLQLKFTVDPVTGAKITGMIGKRGMLEKKHYEKLDHSNLLSESGFKIFLFHTAIEELKPEELSRMEAAPLSLLPRGFDYYAGGHVHIVKEGNLDGYKNVVYPGPVFPNSFSEMEKLDGGSFYIYDNGTLRKVGLKQKQTVVVDIDCEHRIPEQVNAAVAARIDDKIKDSIVLLRLHGTLASGRVADIGLKQLVDSMYDKGAYFVMRNTSKLATKDFSEMKVKADTTEDAERLIVAEHLGQSDVLGLGKREKEMVETLMTVLDTSKQEGEKNADYENRIISEMEKLLES